MASAGYAGFQAIPQRDAKLTPYPVASFTNSVEAPGNLPPLFLVCGQCPFSSLPTYTAPLAPSPQVSSFPVSPGTTDL